MNPTPNPETATAKATETPLTDAAELLGYFTAWPTGLKSIGTVPADVAKKMEQCLHALASALQGLADMAEKTNVSDKVACIHGFHHIATNARMALMDYKALTAALATPCQPGGKGQETP